METKPLRVFPKMIEAACYNRARLALIRVANPLQLTLPRHRGLRVILSDKAWLVVDSLNSDNPVLVWSDFSTADRSGLHEPVSCRLSLFHNHAGLIMGSALEALEAALAEILAPTENPKADSDS